MEPSKERRKELKRLYKQVRMHNRWTEFKYAVFGFLCKLLGHTKKRTHRLSGEYCNRCGNLLKDSGQVRLTVRKG